MSCHNIDERRSQASRQNGSRNDGSKSTGRPPKAANGYTAWANNSQGASTDVANGGRFTSVSAATNAARAEFGPGWRIHIVDMDTHEEVKTFTVRK